MQINGRSICKFAIFYQLLASLFSVEGSSSSCKTNESLSEYSQSADYHNSNNESGRNKRATQTAFFDELLGLRLFNTTMNFIVPGAKINLPRHTEEGSVDHLAMQAFFGIFWAAAWLATIAIPVSQTYFHPLGLKRSIEDDNGMHLKWKLNEKVAESIGLNMDSCLQKSVCQAHEFPEKYGIIGKVIQVIFPADDKLGDKTLHHTRPFHEAAFNGAIGQDCSYIYTCFFDILDVILYVKNHCFATLSD